MDEGKIRLHMISSNNVDMLMSFSEVVLSKELKGIDLDIDPLFGSNMGCCVSLIYI